MDAERLRSLGMIPAEIATVKVSFAIAKLLELYYCIEHDVAFWYNQAYVGHNLPYAAVSCPKNPKPEDLCKQLITPKDWQ